MKKLKEVLKHRIKEWGMYALGLLGAIISSVLLLTYPEAMGLYVGDGFLYSVIGLSLFGIFSIFKWGGSSK